MIEAKSEHEQKARGVAGGEAREASQTKNIYLGPHFAGSSLSFNAGVQFSRDSTVRSTIELKYEKIEGCEKSTLSLCATLADFLI